MIQNNQVRELVAAARVKAAGLAPDSLCRLAATDEWFDRLALEHPPERERTYLPNLLLHIQRLSTEQLRGFDDDVAAVSAASPYPTRVGAFIARSTRDDHESTRQWFAGRAEIGILATLLERLPEGHVEIEPTLPTGKVTDAKVLIDGRWVWIEITALTTSDTDYEINRPELDVHVRYGNPYHDAKRMYRKAFDKIAGGSKDQRSQLHPTDPSIVVIADGATGIGFSSPGIEWAVAQMLDPGQRNHTNESSLLKWIEHDYPTSAGYALDQLEQLSALALYSYRLNLIRLERNFAPGDSHRLTDRESQTLSELLRVDRLWTEEPEIF